MNLYRKTLEFTEISENDVVYDLYTGTGTIAQYIAKSKIRNRDRIGSRSD